MLAGSTMSRMNMCRVARAALAMTWSPSMPSCAQRHHSSGGAVLPADVPLQVLAAVEGDHLAGHRGQRKDRQQRASDFLRRGAVAERHRGVLALELRLRSGAGWAARDRGRCR